MTSLADPTKIQLKLYFKRHLHRNEVEKIVSEIDKLLKDVFGREYDGLFCELYNVIEEVDER